MVTAPNTERADHVRDLVFLFTLAFAFCLIGTGRGSLASWDEAYYAIVSRDIFRSGDWVRLTYAGGPFFDKPPLYFWLTAAAYHIWGVSEWATRLTSGLSGIGVILMTYGIGRRLIGRLGALCGAGLLLSSTDFLHYARWGTLDMTHLFFFTGAVFFYLMARERSAWWLFMWIFSALAVMTKGPLIVLAWAIMLGHALLSRDLSAFRSRWFFLGIPLFIAIVLPWHWAAYTSDPDRFTRDFLYKHYIARTSGAVEGHTGGWYFYIRTLINKYHPWIILAPPALIWALVRSVRGKDRAQAFLLGWVALILGFFTFLVGTKLQWYILPLHPALSLLIGGFTSALFFRGRVRLMQAALAIALFLNIPFSSVLYHDYAPALKRLAADVQKLTTAADTVFLYEFHDQPAASYYFDRPIQYMDSAAAFNEQKAARSRLFIAVRPDQHAGLEEHFRSSGLTERARTKGLETDLVLYSNA